MRDWRKDGLSPEPGASTKPSVTSSGPTGAASAAACAACSTPPTRAIRAGSGWRRSATSRIAAGTRPTCSRSSSPSAPPPSTWSPVRATAQLRHPIVPEALRQERETEAAVLGAFDLDGEPGLDGSGQQAKRWAGRVGRLRRIHLLRAQVAQAGFDAGAAAARGARRRRGRDGPCSARKANAQLDGADRSAGRALALLGTGADGAALTSGVPCSQANEEVEHLLI